MIVRRIAMNLDTGAPLTGEQELDPPDLLAKDELGLAVIDPASHMRRAMPRRAHERFLRRPYNYEDAPARRGALADSGCSSSPSRRTPSVSSCPSNGAWPSRT